MVSLHAGHGGLPLLRLTHPEGSTAEVYLHGAHVVSWVPAGGGEALFLSRAAEFREGSAIRGGVPVIFPQFGGAGPLPKHGFARVQPWEWVEGEASPGGVHATLELRDSAATRALWPHPFRARLRVVLGADTLEMELEVENAGTEAFHFTAALHTYLRVDDVRRAALEGLAGVRYRSALGDGVQPPSPAVFDGEVDRVYLEAPPELTLHDPAGGRALRVRSQGFPDVVVWNPWAERAAALSDMATEEYLEMLCVEAARVAEPVRLEPGRSWKGSQRLQQIPLVG